MKAKSIWFDDGHFISVKVKPPLFRPSLVKLALRRKGEYRSKQVLIRDLRFINPRKGV